MDENSNATPEKILRQCDNLIEMVKMIFCQKISKYPKQITTRILNENYSDFKNLTRIVQQMNTHLFYKLQTKLRNELLFFKKICSKDKIENFVFEIGMHDINSD